MDEIWKDITGFENMYQVSNLGRVKSLPKLKRVTVFNKAHIKIMTKERIIGGSLDKSGYIQINLRKNRKIKKYRIHRLVAEAFLPPIEGCNIVNHKNGIKNDNRLSNLEWCTEKDNTHHCMYVLKNKWWICHEKAVEQYSLEGILIERYSSITKAAKSVGILNSSISSCCNGKTKTSGGYVWRFATQ